jgi:hypothetical protein
MAFDSMSPQAKMGAAGGGCAALGSASYLIYRVASPQLLYYLSIGTLLVAVLMGGFYWLVQKYRQRKARPMERSLRDNLATTPTGVAEPARRARLDDIRKNFEDGVEKFKSAGKNLYSLPWYVLVGEPGSGKTEAIRHCNVGFPPGLQDQLQGVGGTINMNWWFTNHAVVLDTAGRLMFEEVDPGATNEWREFLKLLRTNRPNCPINGMLLCIPADSLIKDTADTLERKGAKIAQQLDQIQRALGVRFPVFVMITKCDLINGFREFFEDITDPTLQHQMMGWSNPAPLDESFNPELVTDHLQTVAVRLKRRRLGLLLDPVNAEDPSARRTDQVDALYALPHSMMTIAPRLRRYLEMIFVAGEWSAKPLFLRGIYFTSSMREGSALDAELAEVLGVPVESLPEGKVWQRDRAYFLRDLFMNKVFREKGLVTNATNAKRHQRRRKAVVLASGFLAVVAIGLFTWWGISSFQKSIGAESQYWAAAAEKTKWDENNYWVPIVSPEFMGSTNYSYGGRNEIEMPDGAKISVGKFHADTMKLVQNDIYVPWVFRLAAVFTKDMNANRRQAQAALFEAGVLRPLIDSARRKVLKPDGKWSTQATGALVQLVRLEKQGAYANESERIDPNALFQYVLKDAQDYKDYRQNDLRNFSDVMDWTYGASRQPWPPRAAWPGAESSVAAVDRGVESFIDFWKSGGGIEAGEILDAITRLKDALVRFGQAEEELIRVDDRYANEPAQPDTKETLDKVAGDWTSRLAAVTQEAGKIDSAMEAVKLGDRKLVDAYDVTIAQRMERAKTPHEALIAAARPKNGTATAAVESSDLKLVRKHLVAVEDKVGNSLSTLREQYQKGKQRQELAVLDPLYLDFVDVRDESLRKALKAERARMFAVRSEMYNTSNSELVKQDPTPEMASLAPTVAAVQQAADGAGRRIGDIYSLAPKGFRFDDAQAVSKFVTDRLAKRKQIYALLKGVLESAPKNADAVAGEVAKAVKEKSIPQIARPVIPGTKFKKDEMFPDKFHPKAAAATFGGWTTIASYAVPAAGSPTAVDVINRSELAALYQSRQDAYTAYLDQYQSYWTKDVLADLAYGSASWKDFQKDLIGMQVRTVTEDLERLGRTIASSLKEIEPVVPAAGKPKYDQVLGDLTRDIGRFGLATYGGSWEAWLRRWKDLGDNGEAARKVILARTPSQFIDDYIPFSAGVDTMISEKYWKELAYTGLGVLAKEVNINVQAQYEAVLKYKRFPLGKPVETEKELTADEAAAALKALATVLGSAQLYDAKSIGGGARTRTFDVIDERLGDLCGLGLEKGARAWCMKAKTVLDGLPAGIDKLTCTVRIIDEKNQKILNADTQSVLGMWASLEITQSGTRMGIKNIIQAEPAEVGKVNYPGDSVVLRFYRFPDDVAANKVDREMTIPGTWAAIRMIHMLKAKPVDEKGLKWNAQVIIPDTESKQRSMWLELEFAKPLPKLVDWP